MVGTQVIGIQATIVYDVIATFIILKVIDLTIGLRVTEAREREGLELALHGERVERRRMTELSRRRAGLV